MQHNNLGYPPAIIHKRDGSKYLDALDRADKCDPSPLGEGDGSGRRTLTIGSVA
jgi:hypothetical protein